MASSKKESWLGQEVTSRGRKWWFGFEVELLRSAISVSPRWWLRSPMMMLAP